MGSFFENSFKAVNRPYIFFVEWQQCLLPVHGFVAINENVSIIIFVKEWQGLGRKVAQ